MNFHVGAPFGEHAAKLGYVRVQRIGLNRIVEAVNGFLQHLALHRASVPVGQCLEQQELPALQAQGLAIDEDFPRTEVVTQVA